VPASPGEAEWESLLKRKLEEKFGASPEEAKRPQGPVRLSELHPPKGRSAAAPPPGPPAEAVEGRPAPPAGAAEAAALRDRLEESERARRAAESRVARLEEEVAALQAASPEGGGPAQNHEEIERLRSELAEARAIIRAIEEAFLAGERGA
jgi:hypothetical protein